MKKLILNISLITLVVVIMPSCHKQLDQEPSNGVRVENEFNTLADFEQNTRGMYYKMVHAEHTSTRATRAVRCSTPAAKWSASTRRSSATPAATWA